MNIFLISIALILVTPILLLSFLLIKNWSTIKLFVNNSCKVYYYYSVEGETFLEKKYVPGTDVFDTIPKTEIKSGIAFRYTWEDPNIIINEVYRKHHGQIIEFKRI